MIVCSDGVTDNLTVKMIESMVAAAYENSEGPEKLATVIVERALHQAGHAGGKPDDITCVAAYLTQAS